MLSYTIDFIFYCWLAFYVLISSYYGGKQVETKMYYFHDDIGQWIALLLSLSSLSDCCSVNLTLNFQLIMSPKKKERGIDGDLFRLLIREF